MSVACGSLANADCTPAGTPLWPDTQRHARFSDETVIQEHIDSGITLTDTVNFPVDNYELVRTDYRGVS